MISQNLEILSYLKTGKTLTPLQALKLFGSLRLGARIFNLREQGHNITSTMIEVGEKRVALYALA